MSETGKGRISREQLQAWLDSGTGALQASTPNGSSFTLIKISKRENVEYIFGQDNYHTSSVGWHDPFTFCGVYSSQNHLQIGRASCRERVSA